MTDERRSPALTPHLRTRPATMLTAIGLCVLIMLIQLVPEITDATSRFQITSASSAR
ncbi:MAG: hypothetical protein ACHQK9_20775 [Reyranellales bacterium]